MRAQPRLTAYDFREACAKVLGTDAAPPDVRPAARAALDPSSRAALAADAARRVLALGRRLAVVAETVELARCTGLDLETILWRAASVRTEQLVLGAGRTLRCALPFKRAPPKMHQPWASDTTPFLHHPSPLAELQPHQRRLVDTGLMGHSGASGSSGYHDDAPVVVLDFASLRRPARDVARGRGSDVFRRGRRRARSRLERLPSDDFHRTADHRTHRVPGTPPSSSRTTSAGRR